MPLIHDITMDRQHALVDLLAPIKPKTGVEVGVRHGDTSIHLLEKFSELTLTLVDPYAPYQDTDHKYEQPEQDKIMAMAQNRLKAFTFRTRWMRMDSAAATQVCRNEGRMFDFVFIDANHAYEYVKKDIELWLPFVRPGGVLSGHDFNLAGVKKAVCDLANDKGYSVIHYTYLPEVWAINI